jgi:uncharacterized protein (DUF433 family)
MEAGQQAVATAPRRIVRDPAILSGEPIVEGTRVPVASLVSTYRHYRDLQRVHGAYLNVDIATIEAALRFYEEHREEIDRLMAADQRDAMSPGECP